MGWQYRIKAPNEKVRDPIQGEFFSTEAIKNPADALVREAIQNALDATLKDGNGELKDVLRARFFLAAGNHALPSQQVAQWFDGAWEHFHAPGNGLREPPKKNESCSWLVFEDFGTCGLEGDIKQSEPIDGVQNHFFYFFRAEGKSVEGGKERGRWGVGKYVFPRSSRANTFFGLSVRNSDKKCVLLGTSVFKSHRLEGKYFCPDGYYGVKDHSDFVLPFTDTATLDKFSKVFQLKRTTEPGLSVIMPWVDPEITAKAIIEAVVRGYFYPILTGALSVSVETPEKTVIIDDSTLDAAALMLDQEESNDVLNLVELAEWASTRKPQEIIKLAPCDPERPDWTDSLIPADQLKSLRATLENGDKVAIRASLTVREKGKDPQPSHFDFFLWKDGFESGRPVFIREGLIISDVRAPRARGIRSFVVTEAGPLGTLLGDAENPAHTEWQSKGENFRGKYTYGASFLDFVTKIVANFVHALTSQDEEEDKTLLLDVFSLPPEKAEEQPKQPEKKKKKKGKETADDPNPQEPKKKRFRVKKSDGGFTVMRGDAGTQPPARLDIKCAYDTRGKNPLYVYRKSLDAKSPDFQIGKDAVNVVSQDGIKIVEMKNNWLRIEVLKQDFELTVGGFDKNRDLFVNVKMEEGQDDSQI
jgi:hypothetical protein